MTCSFSWCSSLSMASHARYPIKDNAVWRVGKKLYKDGRPPPHLSRACCLCELLSSKLCFTKYYRIITNTTNYTLTSISDANGCVRTSSITGPNATITVNSQPVVTVTNACISGGNVTFTQAGGGAGTWTVSGGGTIVAGTGVFTPTTPGCFTATYTVTAGGCNDTKSFDQPHVIGMSSCACQVFHSSKKQAQEYCLRFRFDFPYFPPRVIHAYTREPHCK